MSAQERSNVITRVEQTQWGKRRLLAQLQVPRSTYYRWRARELQGKQECPAAITRVPWNRLRNTLNKGSEGFSGGYWGSFAEILRPPGLFSQMCRPLISLRRGRCNL